MAYSYVRYTGNGSTTNYTFSFPYISSDHIKVRVDGTLVTTWSFLNSSTIQFLSAPANGAVIEIRRETPKDSTIVNFTDGSVLLERDLDLLATYDLYLAQETKDGLDNSIQQNSLGQFDALNKRIINVADPVDAQDAVTKNWIETTYTDEIEAIALDAASSALAAAGSASTATTQANNAAASAVSAANSAAAAATALDNFDDRYLGQKASDPSVDNDGNALVTGALYYNTADGAMRVYTGSGWINASSAQVATMKTYVYVATAGQTTFSGNDANGSSLTFVAPYIIVSLNGLELRPTVDYTMSGGSSVTLTAAASAGDEVQIQAFSNFNVANIQASNVTYSQGGTGSTARFVESKLKETVSVKDFGAIGDGVTDDTAAITAALSSGALRVYAPGSGYKITSKLTIPAGVEFFGDGRFVTTLTIAADVVGVELSTFSKFRGFKVIRTGTHTNNGVDAGTPTSGGGRMVIEDIWVHGAGLNGICVRNGNLGTIRDVVCTNNGQDGINFTIETADNNAWKLEGVIDLRGNTRDGLNFAAGSSASDPNAPRTNSCDLVVTQQNGRYGVYLGTRNNHVVVYAEANTTKDIYIDTYGKGNHVVVVEAGGFTDVSGSSLISYHNAQADYVREFKGKTNFQGGAGKGLYINNSDGTAGSLSVEKVGTRSYRVFEASSNADSLTTFDHFNGTNRHDVRVKGYVTPDQITLNDGASYGILKTVNATTTGTLSFFKSAANTHYFQTNNSGGGHFVYFDAANGPTNWYFKGVVAPSTDNSFTLGASGLRWSVVYAGTATINTSDERTKQQVQDIDDAVLRAWGKVKFQQFKFNDAVEKKGPDGARWHFGVIAQHVKAAFESEGLDAFMYGLLCYDEFEAQYEDVFEDVEVVTVDEDGNESKTTETRATGEKRLVRPAGNMYGIRYEEALVLECAYLRSKLNM